MSNGTTNANVKWKDALEKFDTPNSAVVWVVWLLGQLTVSVLLLSLTGLHFGLTNPCSFYNTTTDASNNMTTKGALSCGFSVTVLILVILACIASIVDATINYKSLIHKVFDKPSATQDSTSKVSSSQGIPGKKYVVGITLLGNLPDTPKLQSDMKAKMPGTSKERHKNEQLSCKCSFSSFF